MKKQTKCTPNEPALDPDVNLERERNRAERLLSALLRAKADVVEARAALVRLQGDIAGTRRRTRLLSYAISLAFLLIVGSIPAVLILAANGPHHEITASAAVRTEQLTAALLRAQEDAIAATANAARLEAELADLRSQQAAEALRAQKRSEEVRALREKILAARGTAAAAMLALADEARNVARNEMTTPLPITDVVDTGSVSQNPEPPRVASVETAPAAKPVLKKPTAKKVVAAKPVPKKTATKVLAPDEAVWKRPGSRKLVALDLDSHKSVARKPAAKRAAVAAREHAPATRHRAAVGLRVGPYPGYAAVL
jgi:histone H1/5